METKKIIEKAYKMLMIQSVADAMYTIKKGSIIVEFLNTVDPEQVDFDTEYLDKYNEDLIKIGVNNIYPYYVSILNQFEMHAAKNIKEQFLLSTINMEIETKRYMLDNKIFYHTKEKITF